MANSYPLCSRVGLSSLVAAEIAASGRTQSEICAAVGISEKHLSRFVNGYDGMSLDLVDAVLAELGRSLVLGTCIPPAEEVDS